MMSDQPKKDIPGNTPIIKLDGIYFKCEYENPTGSHKDRAFFGQIAQLKKQGVTKAVISSSGNAAISAAYYCNLEKIDLTVFISPNININKLKVLENLKCQIITTQKPISDAFKFAKENGAYNLRQSTNKNASIGYETIATEIVNAGVSPDAIFIPVSSGTAFVGISGGFEKAGYKIPINAVQTDAVNPIASQFDGNFKTTGEKSLADAIVAKFTPREDEIIKIIKETNGSGWVITNPEMRNARDWLINHKINCSYEGAAALAALWKAKRNGFELKNPVCLLTGKNY